MTNNSSYIATAGHTGDPAIHNHNIPSHVHNVQAVPDPNNPGMLMPGPLGSAGTIRSWTDEDVDRMVKSAVAEAVAWHTAEIEELRQYIDDLEVDLEVSYNDFHKQQGFIKNIQLPKHRGIFKDAEKD